MVRTTADNDQIVVPSSHQWTIFKELHEKMTNLGTDHLVNLGVYHLAKERVVYLPCFGKDICNVYLKKRQYTSLMHS